MRARWRAALAALACLAGAGCALFEDDPPTRACTRDSECFQAQGEACDLEKKVCAPRPDGGAPRIAPAPVAPGPAAAGEVAP